MIVIIVVLTPVVMATTLEVTGTIFENGTVEVTRLAISSEPATSPITGGTNHYSIALLDNSGNVITQQSVSSSYGVFADTLEGEDRFLTIEGFPITVRIPITYDAHTLIVIDDQTEDLLHLTHLPSAACTQSCVGCAQYYSVLCDEHTGSIRSIDIFHVIIGIMVFAVISVYAFLIVRLRRR